MNRRELLVELGLAAATLPWAMRAVSMGRPVPAPALSRDEREILATVADLYIPATDTPGAAGAGVVDFMDMMLARWFSPAERAEFMAGVAAMDASSRELCGAGFLSAGAPTQAQVLTLMENHAQNADGKLDPSSAIARMKLLILTGYYTSEVGASVELDDTMVFPSFEGCIDLGPDDRAQSMTTPTPTAL